MAENQGNGIRTTKPKRINRVLNYPGLTYYDEKLKRRFIRTVNHVSPDGDGDVSIAGSIVEPLTNIEIETLMEG